MLSEPLQLHRIEATTLFDFLYQLFHRDFVATKTYLNNTIFINPQSHRMEDGKEKIFWHLTSRKHTRTIKKGNRYERIEERLPDYARAERIEWVKKIIQNHQNPRIICFYHRETNPHKDIRLYLWAKQDNFVVILQKLGKSQSFLVTSFYIDREDKKEDFQKRYKLYRTGALAGCEWF